MLQVYADFRILKFGIVLIIILKYILYCGDIPTASGIGPIPERGTSVGIGRFSGEATSVPATRAQEELRSENAPTASGIAIKEN